MSELRQVNSSWRARLESFNLLTFHLIGCTNEAVAYLKLYGSGFTNCICNFFIVKWNFIYIAS